MPDANIVIISGRLGRDPDSRFTQGGKAVCNFSVGVSEEWTDAKTGEVKKRTAWVRCAAWGKDAEYIGQTASKGSRIVVHGRLSTNEWTDKEGKKRESTEVTVSLAIVEARDPQRDTGGQRRNAAPTPQQEFGGPGPSEEDIPF